MAKKFLTAIDLGKCELLNASIHNLATAPSAPGDGQVYFNTGDGQMYYYNGSSWQSMSGDITSVSVTGTAGKGISIVENTTSDGEYTATVELNKFGIEDLADAGPGADRILFWDESASSAQWLSLGTGIAFSGTELQLTGIVNSSLVNDSVTVVAGDGLTGGGEVELGGSITIDVATTTGIDTNGDAIRLKGADALTDNFVPKWDNSAGELVDSVVYGDGTNVGINTTSPEANLHVVGKGNTVGTVLIETDSAGAAQEDFASLHFRVSDNEGAWKKFAMIAENTGSHHGLGALHLALNSADGVGDSAGIDDAKLTIMSDGSVGIGVVPADDTYLLRVAGDTYVGGNLTVDGTVTYINSNTVEIGDNILLLNRDEAGEPSQNAGLEIERGTSDNVSFLWNESAGYWSTVDQAFHVGSIASESSMTGRNVLIEQAGVVKSISAGDLLGEGITLTEGNGIDITVGGSGTFTIDAEVATDANQGVVELATTAETNAMTDTARAVTPASLAKLRFTEPLVNAEAATTIIVNHALNSLFCIVQVMELATGATVECDVRRVDPDHVELDFCVAPEDGALQVMVMKVA
jgi:hypothetical protein